MEWIYPNEDRPYWNERKKNETQEKPLRLIALHRVSGNRWTGKTSFKTLESPYRKDVAIRKLSRFFYRILMFGAIEY
tara:strand:- start:317 stop:547 length:231 start_codon:yes stop_codon:yes gene_type:complete